MCIRDRSLVVFIAITYYLQENYFWISYDCQRYGKNSTGWTRHNRVFVLRGCCSVGHLPQGLSQGYVTARGSARSAEWPRVWIFCTPYLLIENESSDNICHNMFPLRSEIWTTDFGISCITPVPLNCIHTRVRARVKRSIPSCFWLALLLPLLLRCPFPVFVGLPGLPSVCFSQT